LSGTLTALTPYVFIILMDDIPLGPSKIP